MKCSRGTVISCAVWVRVSEARGDDEMVLPEGLQFLNGGWWVVHAMAVLLMYQFGYARGRAEARREERQRAIERGER